MISAALEFRFDSARTFRCSFQLRTGRHRRDILTVKVTMSDMHIINPLIRKTWCDLLALFFDLENEW